MNYHYDGNGLPNVEKILVVLLLSFKYQFHQVISQIGIYGFLFSEQGKERVGPTVGQEKKKIFMPLTRCSVFVC